ncbi:MAG: VCBS repeat-containing protein, partial [Candidatus Magnetomorum sp.]|nr:VCBS repeat-containing protein [Candidatus Magnetomorum sp.]
DKSATAFGDYDNDGDLDILLTGFNGSLRISKLYRNSGVIFEDTAFTFTGVNNSDVAFGDYDNDGDLDIIITGHTGSGYSAKVYQNSGGIFSEETGINLPGVSSSTSDFIDYDNDGDLDIAISGYTGSIGIAKMYENTGSSFIEDTGISFTGVYYNSSAFGDYDNDGDLDFFMTGFTGSSYTSKVYKNTGGSFSEDLTINLPGVRHGAVAFGDYDNDGDLDILITGDTGSGNISKLYKNTGSGFNEDTNISLPGVCNSAVAFGDYNNDGKLDIILSGDTGSSKITKLYKNTGSNFSEDLGITFTGVYDSSVVFGDYDNDGDLDILLTGKSDSGYVGKIYRNNMLITNTPPSMPSNLNAEISNSDILLSWSAGNDSQSSQSTLNYNLYIGSTPGGMDILSPMALPLSNGYRLLPARGNFQTLTATIQDLPNGTYYWGVQTIDTSFAGSEFSAESSFVVHDPPTITTISNQTIQQDTASYEIAFTATDAASSPCSLILMFTSSNTTLLPLENITYTCQANQYTLGVTPVSNEFGTSIISIDIVDADGLTATTSFDLVVKPENIDIYTVLLIHSDTTNGDTSIIDSSGKDHQISINGSGVSHATDQKKFGNSSIYFDGDSSYFEVEISDDWIFGSEDFTIDFWYYPKGQQVEYSTLFSHGFVVGYEHIIQFGSAGTELEYFLDTGSRVVYKYNISPVNFNNWNHIAVVRHGSDFTFYLNGTAVATNSWSGSIPDYNTTIKFGRRRDVGFEQYLLGYMDEIRISKGIARWTENFIPPIMAYGQTNIPPVISQISDTSIDENSVSNTISFSVTDSSGQALAITYETSNSNLINENSMTFSGDNVSSNGSAYTVIANSEGSAVTLSITPETNQSGVVTITITVTDPYGMSATNSFDLAIIGEQLYYDQTVLMLHMDDEELKDSSSRSHIITINGDAFRAVGQGKFDDAVYFDGDSDSLDISVDDDFYFGTGDFTIDFWIKTQRYTDEYEGYLQMGTSANASMISIYRQRNGVAGSGGSLIALSVIDGSNVTMIPYIFMNEHENWHHIAFTRKNKTFYLFFDGSMVTSMASETNSIIPDTFSINNLGNSPFQGYIDELRIIKGFAVWSTESFTPSTLPYASPKVAPTISLINDQTVNENSISSAINFTVTDQNEQALTITCLSSDESIVNANSIIFSDQVYSNGSTYTIAASSAGTGVSFTIRPETDQAGYVLLTMTITDQDHMTVSTSFNLTIVADNTNGRRTVLLLHMDDDTFSDSSPNSHTTVVNGDTTRAIGQGRFGDAIYFDGTSDSLDIVVDDDFHFGTGDFTIDFWVKTQRYTDEYENYLNLGSSANSSMISIYRQRNGVSGSGGSLIALSVIDGSNVTMIAYQFMTDHENWHHVAFTRKNKTFYLFFDGSKVSTMRSEYNLIIPDTFYLSHTGNSSFQGYIDEVRVIKGYAEWSTESSFTPPGISYDSIGISSIPDQTIIENTTSYPINFLISDNYEQSLTITCETSDESLISTNGISFIGDMVFSNGSTYTVLTGSIETGVTLTITPETNQSGFAFLTITVENQSGITAISAFHLTIAEDQYNDNKTVLLLHMDDDLLSDSSPRSHTIVLNGDVTRSIGQGLFGDAVYFDGAGDYLEVQLDDTLKFGTDDFTIDFWLKPEKYDDSYEYYLTFGTPSNLESLALFRRGSGAGGILGSLSRIDGSDSDIFTSVSMNDLNNWHHIALTRKNKAFYLFYDGALQETPLSSDNNILPDTLYIGRSADNSYPWYFKGYIDEVRMIKGSAIWSESSFNIKEMPYLNNINIPTISSISDQTMVENSSSSPIMFAVNDFNAHALTITYASSDESIVSTNGISFIGDKVNFDGSTYTLIESTETSVTMTVTPETNQSGSVLITITVIDPLGLASSEAFQLTIIPLPTISAISDLFIQKGVISDPIGFTVSNSENIAITVICTSSNTELLNSNSINIADSGSNEYVYDATAGQPEYLTLTLNPSSDLTGISTLTVTVINEKQLTREITFQVNVTLDGTHTVLMLHMDDDQFKDSSPGSHIVTIYGDPIRAVGEGKFGDAIYFDGVGDALEINVNEDFYFGTGDFTIDFWIKTRRYDDNYEGYLQMGTSAFPSMISIYRMRSGVATSGGSLIAVSAIDGNDLVMYSNTFMNDHDNWHHVAFTRKNKTFYLFFDGTNVQTMSSETNSIIPDTFVINRISTNLFQGYIDEVRVIKGLAVWSTESFTPSNAPYLSPKVAPTISLIPDQTVNENSTSSAINLTVTDQNEQALTITCISSDENIINENSLIFSDQVHSNGGAYTMVASSVGTGVSLTIKPETDQAGYVLLTLTITDQDSMTVSTSFNITIVADNTNGRRTVLLLHMDDNAFSDSSPSSHTTVVNGDTSRAVGQGRFGDAIYFDGTSDALDIDVDEDFYFGTGDFTIDFWVKTQRYTDEYENYLNLGSSANSSMISIYRQRNGVSGSGGSLIALSVIDGSNVTMIAYKFMTDHENWHHVAFTRKNKTFYLFFDGVKVQTMRSEYNSIIPDTFYLSHTGNSPFQGYIDEVRVIKGYAEWSTESAFTPPIVPYDASQLSIIPDQTIFANTVSFPINFTVTSSYEQPLTVTCETSDEGLISYTGIHFTGDQVYSNGTTYTIVSSRAGSMATLMLTPKNNQLGTALITITVTDSKGFTVSEQFNLTVNERNLPVISAIHNQSTIIDYPISIPFNVTDIEGGNFSISVSSSNTSLVPNENISITGATITSAGNDYTLNASGGISDNIELYITPSSSTTGDSIITIAINDGGSIVEKAFEFSVLSP